MLYCQKCKAMIINDDRCRNCGYKKIREIRDNDPVYLATKNFIFAGMLEDILEKNKIPYMTKGGFRVAILGRTGMSGNTAFFVPYGAYQKSKELIKDYFGGEE